MRKQLKPGPFLLPFSGLGTRLGWHYTLPSVFPFIRIMQPYKAQGSCFRICLCTSLLHKNTVCTWIQTYILTVIWLHCMHSARYLGDQSVNFSLLGAPVVGNTVGELGRGRHNNGYSSCICILCKSAIRALRVWKLTLPSGTQQEMHRGQLWGLAAGQDWLWTGRLWDSLWTLSMSTVNCRGGPCQVEHAPTLLFKHVHCCGISAVCVWGPNSLLSHSLHLLCQGIPTARSIWGLQRTVINAMRRKSLLWQA